MLSGSYKFGGTESLATENLSGSKIVSGSYATSLGRRSWKRFRGQGNATLHMNTFYRPVPPNQGGGTGSVYSQHPNLFNDTVKRDCPRHASLLDFAEAISTLYKEGHQIIVAGDLNEHINI